jgi:hypothetical protein
MHASPCHFRHFYLGQVELTTQHDSLRRIIRRLLKHFDLRLSCVQLVDGSHCVDPSRYIAACMVAMRSMLYLELPYVNILSKIDLIESYGKLGEFYRLCTYICISTETGQRFLNLFVVLIRRNCDT